MRLYGIAPGQLLQDFIALTPAVVDKVRADVPVGFSEKVADKILDGLLDAAGALEQIKPGQLKQQFLLPICSHSTKVN